MAFHAVPIRRDPGRRHLPGGGNHAGHLRQWHVELPQPHDQPGPEQLTFPVPPVPVDRVHLGRREETQSLVETQRLHRQPRTARERADRQPPLAVLAHLHVMPVTAPPPA